MRKLVLLLVLEFLLRISFEMREGKRTKERKEGRKKKKKGGERERELQKFRKVEHDQIFTG